MEALVNKGHVPICAMPNPKFPQYQCWIFAVTDSFQVDLDEILSSCGKEHQYE